MANQGSILGGSPLGLIGVRSLQNTQGMSSFNSGTSRNLNVDKYNKGGVTRNNRLTTGEKAVRPIPDKNVLNNQGVATDKPIKYEINKGLHNDTINDMSLLNIIEQLSATRGALRPGDFAYLKDVGVFPNNRLMIARRFQSAVNDNIFINSSDKASRPISTLISWKPQDENFLEMNFAEKWVDGEADFTNVLNNIGEDFIMSGLGDQASRLGGSIPLPGFTEIIQRHVLKEMGIIDANAEAIPGANPNLIKMSKTREMVASKDAGSGLECKVSVKMNCEYEIKFISGIDPTIAWMEIISNILRFGTSKSVSWGMSDGFANKVIKWVDNPISMITDFVDTISTVLKTLVQDFKDLAHTLNGNTNVEFLKKKKEAIEKKVSENGLASARGIYNFLESNFSKILTSVLSKYKFKILGILNSLTGNASTPWHITVGNPMRPVFCSGDMYLGSGGVNLTLGPTLGFNNLPSSIKAEFTLENARPWGMQEIMAKFNSGYLRVVDVQKSFDEATLSEKAGLMLDTETGETNLENKPTKGGTASPVIPLGDSQSGQGVSGATQSNDVSNAQGVVNSNPIDTTNNKSALIDKTNQGDINTKK